MESSASSPPPLAKSRVRVRPINPLQTHKFSFVLLLIFLVINPSVGSTTSRSIQPRFLQIPYSKHCGNVVPESPIANPSNFTLQLSNAIFSGGGEILRHQNYPQFGYIPPGSVFLRTQKVYNTENDRIFKLEGRLNFQGPSNIVFNSTHRRLLRLVSYRRPRIPVRPNQARFRLHGFWSSASGMLCMVGSGASNLRSVNVVLKLNYPDSSNIFTSFVNGTLQNLDHEGALNYFKPIEILGVSLRRYNFILIERENQSGGFSAYDKLENVSLGFEMGQEVCLVIRNAGRVELVYLDDCGAVNCNFLSGGSGLVPIFMSFNEVECLENGRVRYLLRFSNYSRNGFRLPFDPSTSLIAEGEWDGMKKHLSLVACPIINVTESLSKGAVGDCSIRLSLRVPTTFSLRYRSTIVGQMWSNKSFNDSSYFGRVALRSTENKHPRFEALKYEYAEYDNVGKSCAKRIKPKNKGTAYPDGYSTDMRFDMTVRNKKGDTSWGYSSPLSVGDKFYKPPLVFSKPTESVTDGNHSKSSMLNISYVISFKNNPKFKLGGGVPPMKFVEISAEGIYDAKTGVLCMIGCRRLALPYKIQKNDNLDCEIVVNAEYPPLNAKGGGNVKGFIESTRSKTDPHFFDRLEIHSNSIYAGQAKESIWRMDLEITMVLISNTLACIFVGLQLFYVNKHPDALPFTSVMMLIILTLAHMIPLLLNFEAMFFSNRKRQTLFSGTDGWLEVNEVLVRVITMIAFLLEFRLLQLTWSARVGDESLKNLWVSDKKVLYLSLPLYIGGGLIAWFVHLLSKPYQSPLLLGYDFTYNQISLWGELKSYAGLVLDAFLLPQIVFNLFCDSRVKALSPSFYLGTTLVRLLPHAYDLYRAHSSTWSFSYIYANPRMDYYSTVWDIIITCGGLLFVFIIYLQQRFGGRCFLPQRYRESSVYEKVPVTSA